MTAASGAAYRRVLLKLSGEALMGSTPFGIDPETVASMAAQLMFEYRPSEHSVTAPL